jgi:hypothetical protein
MHKAILMTLLAVVSGSAEAAWVEVAADENSTLYVEPATINNAGNMVKMRHLVGFKVARATPIGKRYMVNSSVNQDEYDCRKKRRRILFFSWRSGQLGEGEVIYDNYNSGIWERIPPKSMRETLWKIACGKTELK